MSDIQRQIQIGETVVHNRTQNEYVYNGLCSMKVNGAWIVGCMYYHNVPKFQTYVRSWDDFSNKFSIKN